MYKNAFGHTTPDHQQFELFEEHVPIEQIRNQPKTEFQRILCLSHSTHNHVFACISFFQVQTHQHGQNQYRINRLLILIRFRIQRTINHFTYQTNRIKISYNNGLFNPQLLPYKLATLHQK